MFVNVKIERSKGGNNALLYACNNNHGNYMLVKYLLEDA
jgi:ankyrin repeat protein